MAWVHPLAVPAVADPALNRFDWDADTRPRADVEVPPVCLAVQVMNAQSTSAGNCVPGQVVVLPDDEARALVRSGYAREVRLVPGAGLPPRPYTDPRAIYAASRRSA